MTGSELTPLVQAGICFCCVIYTFFQLPEPAGRTFADLDILFERRVGAREFEKTKVDVFHEKVDEKIMNTYDDVTTTETSEQRA